MFTDTLRVLALRPAILSGVGLALAGSLVVLANLPPALDIAPVPVATPSAAEAAAVSEGLRNAKARARFNCDDCGVVESIHRLEPLGTQPGGYEFTVRLRDGSSRMSILASPDTWRVGDSIMLMGGQPAASD
jgi:hypothetical protein